MDGIGEAVSWVSDIMSLKVKTSPTTTTTRHTKLNSHDTVTTTTTSR